MDEKAIRRLHQLARLYGVETTYRDALSRRQPAAVEPLLAVLRCLDAPLDNLAGVPEALRLRRQSWWQSHCEPVVVIRDADPTSLHLRLPASQADGIAGCRLELENDEVRQWCQPLADLPVSRSALVEGVGYAVKHLPLPPGLPFGYHHLRLDLSGGTCQTLLISAPQEAYTPPGDAPGRTWGTFLPLYALRSERSWAAGDLTDLETLLQWVRSLGGSLVGTLPLLATFLDEPFEHSPYAPISRLFWNEFYLDVTRNPELAACPPAQDLLRSPAFQREVVSLRTAPLVDYRRGMALKRQILALLARQCANNASRRAALLDWATAHPAAADYSRFRATVEKQGAGWPAWPEQMRNGTLAKGDYHLEVEHYHLYVQWLADQQFDSLATLARQQEAGLYLDLPLGVHRAGYDAWRERTAFAPGASCGAPPDLAIPGGQNWEFWPPHPERIRQQGYRYYIACLRHHLRHARALRLDHVMGLHHLYWVPDGMSAREGVYVRYHAEEYYAVLTLESQRHQALLVGEDLGTVPRYVRTAMTRHRINRMYILPFEVSPASQEGLTPLPAGTLASLNTHDMLPFAAFWLRKEQDRQPVLCDFLYRHGWLKTPPYDAQAVLTACLRYLSASRAKVLLVNLEDLWLETAPQNIPGTSEDYPNWQRKARYALEEFCRIPGVMDTLREVNNLRLPESREP